MKFLVMDDDPGAPDDFMGMTFLPVGAGMDGMACLRVGEGLREASKSMQCLG